MVPVVAEIALEHKDTFIVAKLDNDENRETVGKYGIRAQPIYIVFQGGEEVGRFIGETPKARFVQNVLNAIDVEEN